MDAMRRGDITEIEVLLAFLRLGYAVSLPYGCKEKYDLAVDIDGHFIRVQCKSSSPYRDGNSISMDTRRKVMKDGKRVFTWYADDEIDYYATTYEGKCYLIPADECHSRKILRLKAATVENSTTINWAEDYELETIVKKIVGEE